MSRSSDLGVTASAHDNDDNTITAAQTKQKINKSTTNNISDDKCNNTYRTTERFTKTKNKKQKTKRHTEVTSSE